MIDKEGWLRFAQQKTGGEVEVPFAHDLPEFADHDAFNQLNVAIDISKYRNMTWLVTDYGSARSEKAASNWFSKACRAAGLEDVDRRTALGLRVTCATRMAEHSPDRSMDRPRILERNQTLHQKGGTPRVARLERKRYANCSGR